MPAVQITHATKIFSRDKIVIRALDDISLQIQTGEIFGLLGRNGAGKTTLISSICGLVELDSGTAAVFGHDCLKERETVSKKLNLVTGFAGLISGLTVIDLLRYYAMLYSISNPQKQIEKVLKQTGLDDKKNQLGHTLSSGYRQRFYIAKALLTEPKLLLMDEPTVGLDVQTARQIRLLIKQLKKQGITILLTTHYMQEAEELCDQIAIIDDGKIAAQGTIAQLKKLANNKTASLEDTFVTLTKKKWEEQEDE